MESTNSVSLQAEGYVEEVWAGDQTGETVQLLTRQSHELALQLIARGERALVLIDTTQVTTVTSRARSAAIKALKESNFQKIAIVTKNNLWDLVIRVTLKITQRDDRSRIFDDRDEALKWLLE